MLGAGGSARAAVWALLDAGASEVLVWNRTPERAQALAHELGARAVAPRGARRSARQLHVGGARGRAGPTGRAALSASPRFGRRAEAENGPNAWGGKLERSASEDGALNQLGLTFDQVGEYSYVVDLVYRSGSTPLLAAARAHGARTLDGLEMLVAQGALSLELWTGQPAPLEVMRRAAREHDPAG